MKRQCRRLRERALQAGLESADAATWRAHCKSCPDCQTEQFLLDTLQRQARDERLHLGQRELGDLLAAARQCQARRQRLAPIKAWTWRAACLALLFGVTWGTARQAGRSPGRRALAEAGTPGLYAEAPGALCGNYAVPLFSSALEHDGAVRLRISAAFPAPLPDIVPGQFVQDLLQNLRERMDQRRQELIELDERDNDGGRERDDASELVRPPTLLLG